MCGQCRIAHQKVVIWEQGITHTCRCLKCEKFKQAYERLGRVCDCSWNAWNTENCQRWEELESRGLLVTYMRKPIASVRTAYSPLGLVGREHCNTTGEEKPLCARSEAVASEPSANCAREGELKILTKIEKYPSHFYSSEKQYGFNRWLQGNITGAGYQPLLEQTGRSITNERSLETVNALWLFSIWEGAIRKNQ